MTSDNKFDAKANAKDYYGQQLQSTSDLKTSACCPSDSIPNYIKPLLANIHDDITDRFYGCGSPLPEAMKGCTVLDLGCGTGRDVYIASQLVGETGFVYGVDMTEEQLTVAKKYVSYHTKKFGYNEPNVSFHLGEIEDLKSAGIEDSSIDLVISNCVINLSENKNKVFEEIFRVLKPGGELYFSDVYSSRRIPIELKKDPILHGECLSGALYIEDFRRTLQNIGIPDYRITSKRLFDIGDNTIAEKLSEIDFYSITIRAFKLDVLEDRCEDYGQIATYLGGIENSPEAFCLDDHHLFQKGTPESVCGNTAAMLEDTRFSPYFKIEGNRNVHKGLFDCSDSSVETCDPIGGNCC